MSSPVREDDSLGDFQSNLFEFDGITRKVYTAGSGPAVVVMPEMPGISPQVARFARWVREGGFTVYLPSLFGRDGAVPRVEEGVEVFRRACVAAEFTALATGAPAPITNWLRALAQRAHRNCGGPGVGAVGMCFTGNYALTMSLDPATVAPVLAQPSLPLDDPQAVASSDAELAALIGPRWGSDSLAASYPTMQPIQTARHSFAR
jgi:dienelactone hydrolase